jgi:lipoprotein-releasing system ATP-binding protein
MKRTRLLLAIACLVLGAFGWWVVQALRGPSLAGYEVVARPLVQIMVATGRVVTVSRAHVGSPVTAVVVERRVREGDAVQPGDVLAVLRADELEASVREAEARLAPASREATRRRDLFKRQLIAAFNTFGPKLFYIPVNPWLLVAATVLATVTGVVSAAVPARRASRLDPVEAIRHVCARRRPGSAAPARPEQELQRRQATEVEVLHGLDLVLQRHDFAARVGASGSGKSTLLNLVGLLDNPTDGELYLLGEATHGMDDARRTALRGSAIGFVFQFHHLIQAFTALENVLMPLMVATGKPTREQLERARGLLAQVGLAGLEHRKPDQLSGGQQQRVVVARALVTRPALLLADEPTGTLDSKSASEVSELFRKFNRDFACAVLLATHDPRLPEQCDRTVTLVDGRIASDTAVSEAQP